MEEDLNKNKLKRNYKEFNIESFLTDVHQSSINQPENHEMY